MAPAIHSQSSWRPPFSTRTHLRINQKSGFGACPRYSRVGAEAVGLIGRRILTIAVAGKRYPIYPPPPTVRALAGPGHRLVGRSARFPYLTLARSGYLDRAPDAGAVLDDLCHRLVACLLHHIVCTQCRAAGLSPHVVSVGQHRRLRCQATSAWMHQSCFPYGC